MTRAESEEGDDKPQAQPVTPWISEVAITHEGVSFAVEGNEAGSTRLADLTLFIEDAEGTATTSVLSISQGIAEPSLKLDSSVETYEGYAQQCTIPATTNNLVPYADQIVYDITYDTPVEEGNEWLSEPMLTDEGLTFSLTQNDSSKPVPPRSTSVTPTHWASPFRQSAKSPRKPIPPPSTSRPYAE